MTAILYPVAENAAAALSAPLGRAARASDAQGLAGQEVAFVTEPTGPAFATQEAALDAFHGRLEDERPQARAQVAPEDRYCQLTEVVVGARAPAPARPALRDGRRWPVPPAPPPTAWRLMVSYWRPAGAERPEEGPQARQARRKAGEDVDPRALHDLTRQPLRPFKLQQPLDIGLFERRLPESPDIVVPDE